MKRVASSLVAALVAVGIFAGCGDVPTAARSGAPALAAPAAPSNGLLSLLNLSNALTRSSPIKGDVSVTKRIGSEGGTIAIPEAGFTLVVPRGAVKSEIELTATALAGKAVAYEFEPHGTQFAKPLRITQELRGTDWVGLPLLNFNAVYFENRGQVDPVEATIQVDEFLALSVDLLKQRASFEVAHFSGYGISTGRKPASE